jgi:hypothetical protein
MLLRACCVERSIFLLSSDSYHIIFRGSIDVAYSRTAPSGCRVWEDERRRDGVYT